MWILLLQDDEGAWALPFSTRRKALAFVLFGWQGSRVYWKRRSRRYEEFCRTEGAYGCRYRLYQSPVNGPF